MLTVWGRDNSINVKKVLWCLEELGVAYRSVPAGGQFGKTHEPEYLAMNPNAQVPCIHDDAIDFTLWESDTIVRYLAAEYGKEWLWISDPASRACGEKWMDWAADNLVAPYRHLLINLVRTAPEQQERALIADSIARSEALFSILDAELATQTWLGGAKFGVADIALGPTIYALFNLDISWAAHENLRRWYQQLTQRPAYQKVVMIPVT
ncbi:glutathione S-transferase family protein [Enterobacter kobei]|uniref:glutathione S-transferase family protein n=1 Tax=Enterobacter TaxID=547 RepID=UPI00062C7AFF|nr:MULTISPECIES: glutathione S-transferase family protein [Enterobacter]KKY78346.1 glutathione S-transferase [Enterobacter cloacae]KZP65702.1 glutathione S-transferase [Enterobacter bugandensis]MCK7113870.1 glutathione S-transferase family protein [Enterobacter kobei]MCM7531723.1 glutathione S-transferase family protein [Enterobacter quasiroggenkampii]